MLHIESGDDGTSVGRVTAQGSSRIVPLPPPLWFPADSTAASANWDSSDQAMSALGWNGDGDGPPATQNEAEAQIADLTEALVHSAHRVGLYGHVLVEHGLFAAGRALDAELAELWRGERLHICHAEEAVTDGRTGHEVEGIYLVHEACEAHRRSPLVGYYQERHSCPRCLRTHPQPKTADRWRSDLRWCAPCEKRHQAQCPVCGQEEG
ncbi:hypothetical protein AB0I28_32695 [Phytomonospora sp. NPDC050363]|uniref:hypothetical protein n=1 Tax=Phytomonospora sp. NPDC050363 TaxID=3155642 RepID=UPI003403D25D